MTMKLTKIAGAFALTAAMAMAAVPAFADPIEATDVDTFTDTGKSENKATAQTKVMASMVNVNVSATIPTRVAVIVPSSGTSTVKCPTAAAYYIHNDNSTGAIKLYNVTSSKGSSAFNLVKAYPSGTSENQLQMQLECGAATPVDLDGSSVNIAAPLPSIAVNDNLGLSLSGNAAVKTSTTLSSAQLDNAIVTINYTIGV